MNVKNHADSFAEYFANGFHDVFRVLYESPIELIKNRKLTSYAHIRETCEEFFSKSSQKERFIQIFNEYYRKFIGNYPLVPNFENDPSNFILNMLNRDELDLFISNMGSNSKNCRENVKRYQMTINDYAWMILRQNNKCACCGKPKQENRSKEKENGCELCIDHCHKTGLIRGLLCNECNAQVGNVESRMNGTIHKPSRYYEYVLRNGDLYMSSIPIGQRMKRFIVPPQDAKLQILHENQRRWHTTKRRKPDGLSQFMH